MAEPIRIQKAVANAGLMSRRKAEDAIVAGRIAKNGQPTRLGDRVDVSTDLLTLDGIPIPVDPDLETHLLYKPVGVVSTAEDTHGRTTVVDLIDSPARLYPVGRLDIDSEGLILLSNDGELTHRVTHPSFGITKTYLVRCVGVPSKRDLGRLMSGLVLDDGPARAQDARVVGGHGGSALVEVVMGEGRNREVRRMFDALGHPVSALVRTAIGPIVDRDLRQGMSRRLTQEEIHDLLSSGSGQG